MERKKARRNIGVFGLIWGMMAILTILMINALAGILIGFVALLPSIWGVLEKHYSKIPGMIGVIACCIAIGGGFFLIITA